MWVYQRVIFPSFFQGVYTCHGLSQVGRIRAVQLSSGGQLQTLWCPCPDFVWDLFFSHLHPRQLTWIPKMMVFKNGDVKASKFLLKNTQKIRLWMIVVKFWESEIFGVEFGDWRMISTKIHLLFYLRFTIFLFPRPTIHQKFLVKIQIYWNHWGGCHKNRRTKKLQGKPVAALLQRVGLVI